MFNTMFNYLLIIKIQLYEILYQGIIYNNNNSNTKCIEIIYYGLYNLQIWK